MEELRQLVLSQLDELRGLGLSESRHELYIDAVYRCEDAEELLALADLELQLEASEALTQLRVDYDDDPGGAYVEQDIEDIRLANDEGFGDSGDEVIFTEDEVDPELLALQRALLGTGDPESDPDYFDIDALLSSGGAAEAVNSATTPEYQDALAALLAAYPLDDEPEQTEGKAVVPPLVEPAGFTTVSGFGAPPPVTSGFGTQPPVTSGFGTQPPVSGFGTTPCVSAPMPGSASQGLKDVFAGFGARKVTKRVKP
ncbi:hypothetical protein FACS1894208_00180 [Clostridia bacterium]|nr:hypothetical protein FACS1894208_00180 [Clostridia bacterium]